MIRILLLQPDVSEQRRLQSLLERNDYGVDLIAGPECLLDGQLDLSEVGAIVADADTTADVFAANTSALRGIPLVLIAQQPNVAAAVQAIKLGASDYLSAPVEEENLLEALVTTIAGNGPNPLTGSFPMIGDSAPMKTLLDSISKIAPTDSTVLIRGESGTGKELVARALHAASNRRQAPMISLNCATIPANLIETELFGHGDSASFSQNAQTNRHGLLQAASGGTLFLDEIGELTANAQARLLHLLERGEIQPSGSAAPVSVDVRLITASHQDLEKLIANEHFREDLYYRLNVVSLAVPPLRERGHDVVLLADAILRRTVSRLAKPHREFSQEALETMRRYSWPGNVRELENAIERAVILSEENVLSSELLAIDASKHSPAKQSTPQLDLTMEDYFVSFVNAHQDQLTETELAEKLGISRKSLWERRQRLNIPRKKTRKRGPRRDVS